MAKKETTLDKIKRLSDGEGIIIENFDIIYKLFERVEAQIKQIQ